MNVLYSFFLAKNLKKVLENIFLFEMKNNIYFDFGKSYLLFFFFTKIPSFYLIKILGPIEYVN